jgi:UDP-N-acetyl-D-galactosamine dehydrogenase
LGLAFKPDIQDISNSKIMDTIAELKSFGVQVFVHDPVAQKGDAKTRYDIDLIEWDALPMADAVVISTPHQAFLEMPLDKLMSKSLIGGCFADIYSRFDRQAIESMGYSVWRL